MPRLDIRRAQRISVHEISDQPVRVGRMNDNDLVLRNIHVSRHHCVIERVAGEIHVRDLGSQSGTWVNSERVTEARLYSGDRVSVGPFDLVIQPAPNDDGFVSRNSALDEALKHVAVDDSTGLPVEGPAALVDDLKKQLETERAHHRRASDQVANLRHQVDELQAQLAASERTALLHEEQSLADDTDERLAALEQELAEAAARAANAERREIERIAQLQSELDAMRAAAMNAEDRAAQLSSDLNALRRESMPPSAAEQIAEMEGLLDFERRRAQTAEQQLAEATERLAEADRLIEAPEHSTELESQLERERQRVEEAAERILELEHRLEEFVREQAELRQSRIDSQQLQAQLSERSQEAQEAHDRVAELERELASRTTDLQHQRESDLNDVSSLRAQIDNLESLLRESKSSSETLSADHRSALQQLHDSEAALADWQTRGQEAEQALETERAHAADLNRSMEEAWAKIDEAQTHTQSLESRLEELESASQRQAREHADSVAELQADVSRYVELESTLRRELEEASNAREQSEKKLADAQAKLETLEGSLHHALARATELEAVSADAHKRAADLEQRLRERVERAEVEIAEREQRIVELEAEEEQLTQRLNNLEATKYAASEKAERALGTLNLLHGQIRSLDDAAAQVSALQNRLARIEEAWVEADETLDALDESDQTQLAAAIEQRQRIVAELDALNKARDVAVSSLRESAMRLRSLSEKSAPVVTTISASKVTVDAGDAGRRWWRRNK